MFLRHIDWIILNELYKEPNLTKVSEKLFYSQPSITKIIKNLEEELDVRILYRSSRGVKFTKEGEYLARRACEYLKFYDDTMDNLELFKNNAIGTLNIGASYTYSKLYLPEILFKYTLNNNVNFNISTKQSQTLFDEIESLDGAFIHGEYEGNIKSFVVDEEYAYIFTKDRLEDINDLKNMSLITYKTNDKTEDTIKSWWYNNFDKNLPRGYFAGYVDVALQLVSKGFGFTICFISKDFTYDDNGNNISRNTYFIYSKNKENSYLFEDFLEYLKNDIK